MTVVASQLGGMNRNDGRVCGHTSDVRCTLRGRMNRNNRSDKSKVLGLVAPDVGAWIEICIGHIVFEYILWVCESKLHHILTNSSSCILWGCMNRNSPMASMPRRPLTLHTMQMYESKSHLRRGPTHGGRCILRKYMNRNLACQPCIRRTQVTSYVGAWIEVLPGYPKPNWLMLHL